jgi:hypothetical protein
MASQSHRVNERLGKLVINTFVSTTSRTVVLVGPAIKVIGRQAALRYDVVHRLGGPVREILREQGADFEQLILRHVAGKELQELSLQVRQGRAQCGRVHDGRRLDSVRPTRLFVHPRARSARALWSERGNPASRNR